MMMAAVIGVVAMDDEQVADAAVGDMFTVGDLRYRVIADGEVEVRGTDLESGAIEIPSTVSDGTNNYVVTSIGNSAFDDKPYIGPVTIPEGITKIENYAFHSCLSIRDINLPESLTYIGSYAFQNCLGFRSSIYIPDAVTYIGSGAFYGCTYLESINIPDGITTINSYTFYRTDIKSINIPDGITTIKYRAFSLCTELTNVTFESMKAPNCEEESFETKQVINVYTPGWDPVSALAYSHSDATTIVWANDPSKFPDLTFLSHPVTNGTLAYNPLRTIKTALTA